MVHGPKSIGKPCIRRWARFSIFELIDTRYLKIELIDTDTRYSEEELNRYPYRRYKYLDTISGKKSIKKIGLQMKKTATSLQSADNCKT